MDNQVKFTLKVNTSEARAEIAKTSDSLKQLGATSERETAKGGKGFDGLGASVGRAKAPLNAFSATLTAFGGTSVAAGLKLESAFNRAGASVLATVERWGSSLTNFVRNPLATAQAGITSFAASMGPLAVGALGVGSAVAIAGAAIFKLGSQAASAAEQIQNLSYTTGLTTTAVQALQLIGQQTGIGDFTHTISRLNKELGSFEGGEFVDSLLKMKIPLSDVEGKTIDAFEALARMKDELAKIPDPTARSMEAAASLSNRLHSLLPLLLNTSINIRDMKKAYEESSAVIQNSQMAALLKLDEEIDKHGLAWIGLKNTVGRAAAEITLSAMKAFESLSRLPMIGPTFFGTSLPTRGASGEWAAPEDPFGGINVGVIPPGLASPPRPDKVQGMGNSAGVGLKPWWQALGEGKTLPPSLIRPGELPELGKAVDFMTQIADQAERARAAGFLNPTEAIENLMGKSGEALQDIVDLQVRVFDEHKARYENMINSIRDGAGRVFDDLLIKGKGAFSSLMNFVNGLLQTMGRKIFQNIATLVFSQGKSAQGKSGWGSIFEGIFPGFSAGGTGGSPAATGINGGTFGNISGGLGGFFKNIFRPGAASGTSSFGAGLSSKLGIPLTNAAVPGWAGAGGATTSTTAAAGMSKMASGLSMAGMTAGMMLFQSGMAKGSKLMTTIGGAATGASVGFQVGGPMGAAIGAGVGAVGGFVAGIFSSAAKRRAQEIAGIEQSIRDYEAMRAPTIGTLGESMQGRGLSVGLRDGVRQIRWDRLEKAIEKLGEVVGGFEETVTNFETLSPGVVVKRGADGASREILAATDRGLQNNRELRLSISRTVLEET